MHATRNVLRTARTFGQALHANRPHLVDSKCITPLIPASEFKERRLKLANLMKPKSLAIVAGNQVSFASQSVFHSFRQDPQMQYLSGFLEPDSSLLLYKSDRTTQSILVVPEKEPHAEKWEGERTGSELAAEIFGVDHAVSNTELQTLVTELVKTADFVYADLDPKITARQGRFFDHHLKPILSGKDVLSLQPLVDSLRVIKSENEIDAMRVAAEISAGAYNAAYKRDFVSEHQLHAFLDFMFRHGGCESDAYRAVVAGGEHALTIHYVRNDDILKPEDLVLVDAAGRYGGYCADISRTWPVSGSLSSPQRDLYEAVLAVEKQCIGKCVVDSGFSLHDLHRFSEKQMRSELKNAGLELSPSLVSEIYPHMIGHHLGLDVHDIAAPSSRIEPLRSNMVITVEPGVYIPRDDRFPKHYQGMGIRIEDNVVIGKTTNEVLTEDCLKEVEDIEH